MKNPLLVQIGTEDGLILPGLLYEVRNSKKAAIFLHGNGSTSVFYSDDLREKQAKVLNKIGISYLLFNNRGAHYMKKLDFVENGKQVRKLFGMTYEKIKDCVKDVDAAIKLLEVMGYNEFYLIGESTGANKICVYNYYKPQNKVFRYILIGGGDDTGIYYDLVGHRKFFKLLETAREKIKNGKGEEIITSLLSQNIFISNTSFYDTANPDGDYNVFPFYEVLRHKKLSKKSLFRYFKSIKKQTLVIYGEKDEYAWGNVPKIVKILKEQKPDFDYFVIKDGDHSLSKHQSKLTKIMQRWLS